MKVAADQFFDALSGEYATKLRRCVPRYDEMLWALIDYLPKAHDFESILELGCGTGNLSVLLADHFPHATCRFVDFSGESLRCCESRVGTAPRFVFEQTDFRHLCYPARSFDLVISSISIHHLTSLEKKALFGKIAGWLEPGGTFAFADQFSGATTDLYQRHLRAWREHARRSGTTEEDWQLWMQHQAEHDHHDSLADQMDWLREAGFRMVDCPWRYLLWSVLQARQR